MAPRSILKVKDAPEGTILSTAAKSKDERNRELALHHASLIQEQKDAQQEVFEAMMILIDLPSSPAATPEAPSDTDQVALYNNIQVFTPSDFDELITERHANGKCGYALCHRPFKQQSPTGKFRILNKTGVDNMRIVEKESLEQWCSESCARRAMYIKVQLSDEPPWLRSSNPDIRIMPEEGHTLALRPKVTMLDAEDERQRTGVEKLRLERHDKETSSRPTQVMTEGVPERGTTRPANEPRLDVGDGDLVEGYKPRPHRGRSAGDDDDSEEDTDWNI